MKETMWVLLIVVYDYMSNTVHIHVDYFSKFVCLPGLLTFTHIFVLYIIQ